MPYATAQDIAARYGQDTVLLLADRDGDGQVDPGVIEQAQVDATAEIDTYVGARYDLPLPRVPEVLVRLGVDITVYYLSASADRYTDERRQRYEDALSLLKRIARGEVSLGMPEPPKSATGSVYFNADERRLTRRSMRRLT